ncbi:hypothetical protein BH20ACT15_BH20ACT15_07490 [soil metagenome]
MAAIALIAPVAVWFKAGIRRQQQASAGERWAWPDAVGQPLAWAFGGILISALGISLPILWTATLAGAVDIEAAAAITVVVIVPQVLFWRAARRVTERQIAAEDRFKQAAIDEFGDEATEQFRALEDGKPGS